MKNLIITTAMVIFILTVMGWQLKLGETLHQKQRLQYAAEEQPRPRCSAWVSADGEQESGLVWDEERARRAAEVSLRMGLRKMRFQIQFLRKSPLIKRGQAAWRWWSKPDWARSQLPAGILSRKGEEKRRGNRETGRKRKSGRDRLNR